MMYQYLIATSLATGWMLSTDVLVRLGQGIGRNSTLYLAAMAAAVLLAAMAVRVTRAPELRRQGALSATGLLIQGIGPLPAMVLTMGSRLSTAIILPVGLLVTAGFAFNEIFVYWFPNFGFSFILLGAITLLHLFGEKYARSIQPLFGGITFLALIILCLAGLGGPNNPGPVSVDTGFSFSGPVLLGAILLFLGYDYITPSGSSESRVPGFAALLLCLFLFIIWSLLSLQHVGGDKLSDSTIPHLIAARKIMGHGGRIVMGIAMIAGTCGLVNMLFLSVTGSFRELAERNLLPGHPTGRFRRRILILLLAITISILLATGLAGSESLETYIQAVLLIWLLTNGAFCLAASRLLRNHHKGKAVTGLLVGTVFVISSLTLAAADPQSGSIFSFSATALTVLAIVSLIRLKRGPTVEIIDPQTEK